MKRGIEEVDSSSGNVNQSNKKAQVDEREERNLQEKEETGDDNISNYLLVNRYRAMALELMNNKRALTEARKELDMMRRKSREMEKLVSLVQRSWSQIDIDSSLILDSLGDSEVSITEEGSSDLLYRLLSCSSPYIKFNPTNLDTLPKLHIDQYSTIEGIQKAQNEAKEKEEETKQELMQRTTSLINSSFSNHDKEITNGNGASNEEVEEVDLSVLFAEQFEKDLQDHVSFTTSLLERLCNALNELADIKGREDLLRPLTKVKENSSLIMLLQDHVVKLRQEVIDLQAKSQLCENEKMKVEKKLDKALFTMKEMEERMTRGHSGSLGLYSAGASSISGGLIGSSALLIEGGADGAIAGGTGGVGGSMIVFDEQHLLHHQAFEKELQQQIELLEKQLADSESAKAKVEMQMTERIAKPLAQTETQVSDMRKTIEELKQQFRMRLGEYNEQMETILKEKAALQETLIGLNHTIEMKISRLTKETQKEIKRVQHEKVALEHKICAMEANQAVVDSLRLSLTECQQFEENRSKRVQQLEKEVIAMREYQLTLTKHLEKSRKREKYLEQAIIKHGIPVSSSAKFTHSNNSKNNSAESTSSSSGLESSKDILFNLDLMPAPMSSSATGTTNSSYTTTNNTTLMEIEDGAVLESKTQDGGGEEIRQHQQQEQTEICDDALHQQLQSQSPTELIQMVKQVQERCQDVEKELQETKSSVDEMILEIDAITSEEANTRAQSQRLLIQIAECQTIQRDALEENLRLHNQLDEMKITCQQADTKVETIKSMLSQQDALLQQMRQDDNAIKTDVITMNKLANETNQEKASLQMKYQDLEHKYHDTEHQLQAALKRNQDLTQRCDDLTKQTEAERKKRYDDLRSASKKERLQRDTSNSSSGSNAANGNSTFSSGKKKDTNDDMLEMTLGMLRCSVCRDRFKSVAITRCFHLFCKECIDETLRNRSRKCPACGEKFGQDDVATVYFTH